MDIRAFIVYIYVIELGEPYAPKASSRSEIGLELIGTLCSELFCIRRFNLTGQNYKNFRIRIINLNISSLPPNQN